jgi:hypothetical protein
MPERQKVIDRLCAVQERGLMRRDADPYIVADQLSALVFMGAMRGALPLPRKYSTKGYLEACVATIVRAIETPEPEGSPRPGEPGAAQTQEES